MSSAYKRAKEIANYYLFHKKLELIYLKGLNHFYQYSYKNMIISFFGNSDINVIQKFYIIERNFFLNWKSFVNYSAAVKYLDTINALDYKTEAEYEAEINERCDNMVSMGVIKDDSQNERNKPYMIKNSDFDLRNFIHKIIFKLEDFDYLIDEKTYNLFYASYTGIDDKSIEGLVLDKMIAFLIKEERKMKFLFNHNSNMLHITADFNVDEGYKSSTNISSDNAIQSFDEFYYAILLKKESNYILNEFIKQGILSFEQVEFKSLKGEIICKLKNDSLFKQNDLNNYKNNNTLASNIFDNINQAKFIGLTNIGATCYMNATLQNLINTDLLTRYLLNQKNYTYINNNPNNFELCSKYCEVLYHTCISNDGKNYYEPKNFKEIISRKNPLFEGIQANDSKDLVNFLLEEMHSELKLLENNKNNNPYDDIQLDMTNQIMILNNFKKIMGENNRSIISKLFYILVESVTNCKRCNFNIYNYEVTFFIEFPLENVYKYCCNNNIPVINQNNKKCIPLMQCFNNYYQPTLFTGENQIYCNMCKCQTDACYINNFYSFPPYIIIVLNRGKGNVFDCEVDFPLDLSLKNYCKNFEGNVNYKLKGVITHLGPSGMSGHFIAYCRHRITNEWYCYNDASVSKLTDQNNGYKKGTPYILFYEGMDNQNNFIYPDISINNINNMNNMNNMNNISGFNQNMNMNNMNMNFQMFPMNNINTMPNMGNMGMMNNIMNFNSFNNNCFNSNININSNFNNMNNMNNISNSNNNLNAFMNMNNNMMNNINNNMINNMNNSMMNNMNNNMINNMSNIINNNMNNNFMNNNMNNNFMNNN